MRIKMTLAYDGQCFHGWQIQPNLVTVQGTLEEALAKLFNKETRTYVSGRTDEGVSALAQVVHFDCETTIPPDRIYLALNFLLPEGIKATNSELVDDSFNARYDVKKKTYLYRTYYSRVEIPFEKYRLQLDRKPCIEKMREAAKILIGEHDFAAFCATNADTETTIRTLYNVEIIEKDNQIDFRFTGSGFLYNMVRIMVGTLLFIGYGTLEMECIQKAFETGDRSLLGKTVSSKGLLMEKVEY